MRLRSGALPQWRVAVVSRPRDEGQAYRLVWWVACGSVALNIVQGLGVAALAGALVYSVARDKTQLGVVAIDNAEQKVLRVEPAYSSIKAFDAVAKGLAQRYVELREQLDLQTEAERWREASYLASQTINEPFKALMEKRDGPYQVYRKATRRRFVKVVATTPTGASGDGELGSIRKFLVEWEATDADADGRRTSRWYSHVVLTNMDVEVRAQDLLLNPFGMLVTDYEVSKKAES